MISIKKKIFFSLLINLSIYLIAGLLPCHDDGIITLCANGILQPFYPVLVFMMQFGIIYHLTDLDYYIHVGLQNFPNFSLFVIIWAIVLLPFYFERLIKKLTKSHK